MNNDKVLVEISVPAAGETFDVYMPLQCRMSEVLVLVSNALSDLSNEKYRASNDAVLCDKDSGIIYNLNMDVEELGIKNGSRLMLI